MAQYVLLRCSIVSLNGDIVVSAYSASANDITVGINDSAAAAMQSLTDNGYVLTGYDADPLGFSYTFTRDGYQPSGIRELLLERLGQTVALETSAGTVSGVVLQVGIDVVELREASGDILLVPLASILTVI